MPRAKKNTDNTTAKVETKKPRVKKAEVKLEDTSTEQTVSKPTSGKTPSPVNLRKIRPSKAWLIPLVVLLLLALVYYKRSWFIAASVDGMPITNLELQQRLNSDYRDQTLTQMINEKVILDAGKKNNITVTDQDINNKIASIEDQVGGADQLDSLLSQQGQTRASLRDQVKIQLIIERMYDSQATVSAQEVDQYIAQNKDMLKATDSAGQKQEAEQDLKQQKIGEIFNQQFPQLKSQANVTIY